MIKNNNEHLTFEEELLVAIYYNNVEKLKWLMGMDYFKPFMVIDPIDFGEVSVPLYWLTICYHYMLRYDEFKEARLAVDEILSIWQERFNLDIQELIDLKGCYHKDCIPLIYKENEHWWMGHFELGDFVHSGLREVDYNLYKAIDSYNIEQVVFYLNQGGAPDAKIIDHDGNCRSAISMLRYWKHDKNYLRGKEAQVYRCDVGFLISDGLQEMILYLLENNMQKRDSVPVETFSDEVDMLWYRRNTKYIPKREVIDIIDCFIKEIDKPGAVLAVFDEGKTFARYYDLQYVQLYRYVFGRVFKSSKHIRLRVGGYSFRAARNALEMAKELSKDRIYIEYLSVGDANFEYSCKDDTRIKVIGMEKYNFRRDMNIVKLADKYDFKTFGNNEGLHTMVHFYVNNIDIGFYDDSGEFHPFYHNYRGLQAITDVVMINGYDDITPATAVMSTFTFDSGGDSIYCGGTCHKDRRSRVSSQKALIESAGIKLLDLTAKI